MEVQGQAGQLEGSDQGGAIDAQKGSGRALAGGAGTLEATQMKSRERAQTFGISVWPAIGAGEVLDFVAVA